MLAHKRFLLEIFRSFYTTSQIGASHYDVLGITPKATQNDIKSAYYKLSKLHHPDKSKDEESAKKFRAITEAYEVLGNIKLKKMYDKGLLVGRGSTTQTDFRPEEEPTDPTLKFYKSRNVKNVVPTMDGRTPIYDFDSWSKHHYGNLVKKTQEEKQFAQKMREKRINKQESANQEFAMFSMFAIGAVFIFFIIYGTADYDTVDEALEIQKIGKPQSSDNLEKTKDSS